MLLNFASVFILWKGVLGSLQYSIEADGMDSKYELDYEIPSKIPKDAKLAFKGAVWEVYQWQQKMFDGTYETFEGLKLQGGVKVIATKGSKLFMSKEETPADSVRYTLLGGGINSGETPLEAAKRELLEESGMVSNNWELVEVIDLFKYRRVDSYIYLFIAKECEKVAGQKLDPGERINVEEVDFDQFIDKLKSSRGKLGSTVDGMLNDPEFVDGLRRKLEL